MKIILEGFDGSGKSTLARHLAKVFNLTYIWATGPARDPLHAMECCCNQYVAQNCVLDRITPISRQCYQFLVMEPDEDRRLDLFLRYMQKDSLFIYCLPVGEQEDKDHDTEDFKEFLSINRDRIIANYERIFKDIPHFVYDFTKVSFEEVEQWIKEQRLLREVTQKF